MQAVANKHTLKSQYAASSCLDAHVQPHLRVLPKTCVVSRIAPRSSLAFKPARTSATQKRLSSTKAVRADQQVDQLDSATLQLISNLSSAVDAHLSLITKEHIDAARSLDATTNSELRSKIVASITKLSTGLLERETEVRLLLLAALCGEHILLLGPPGTAKSELSRRLHKLCGGDYFERLLTRFSVPEELFGPLSMKGLENDEYVRQTAGYLPTAEVAFIDEIFKANSAILNALLTILNERLFDNGNQRLQAPLLCLVGASNELPESEELDALYDRFLVRRTVAQVSNAQLHKLARLAAGRPMAPEPAANGTGTEQASGPSLTIADFKAAADQAYEAVDVPDGVIDLITSVRNYLQDKCEPPIYVSDRRFMKAVQMLQVVAHGDGRDVVHEYDCLLLEHVFGNMPDDCHKVRANVLDTIAADPGLQQTELVFLGLFGRACRVLEGGSSAELPEALEEANVLVELLSQRHRALVSTLEGAFPELRSTVWQSDTTVQAAVQALTPQMTENRKRAEELLREALVLQQCLQQATAASVLERLLPKRYKQYSKGISGKA